MSFSKKPQKSQPTPPRSTKFRIFLVFAGLILFCLAGAVWNYFQSPRKLHFTPFSPTLSGRSGHFSQQGDLFFFRISDSLQVYDVSTGKLQHVLTAQPNEGINQEVSPDGKLALFSGISQPTVWDIPSGTMLFTIERPNKAEFTKPQNEIVVATFFEQGQKIFVLYGDYQSFIWNVKQQKILSQTSLEFLRENQIYPSCQKPSSTSITSKTPTPEEILCTLRRSATRVNLTLSSDGKKFLVADPLTDSMSIWDLEKQKKDCTLAYILPFDQDAQNIAQFIPETQHVLIHKHSYYRYRQILFWFQTTSGNLEQRTSFPALPKEKVSRLFYPVWFHNKIIFGDALSELTIWDAQTDKLSHPIPPRKQTFSWLRRFFPEEPEPYIYDVFWDVAHQQMKIATEKGIETWSL